ncbi:polyprenyl synthetase family protein [Streptomyces sp. JB150]|uniref:polyprenyl synthetase family protein n=1 Tax=Streptomyces sp. JB150 TaxID=2714844 RepID=UPI001F0E8C1B|nr:polyprenyl synthetase family protein [Streptomyces sp. JB150]
MADTADPVEETRARVAGYESRFNARFAAYFDTLAATLDAPGFSRFAPECVGLLRELSPRGGKRMRVALLYEAARLVTAGPVAGLDAAALSVELLQTHGLIHDDIVDDSPVRRGGPSTHQAYRERFPGHPRTALGLAVLAGGPGAGAVPARPPRLRRAAARAARHGRGADPGAVDTFVGQIVDLERDFTAGPPDEEVLHAVADYKSARYSLLAPWSWGCWPPARSRGATRQNCGTTPGWWGLRADARRLPGPLR